MRRWLLVLMVLLLPLRGWVGEAMAGQMLQQQALELAAAAHAPSAVASPVRVHALHGCNEEAEAPAASDAQHDSQHAARHDAPHAGQHAHGGACTACQVCSSVALSTPGLPSLGGSATQPRPESVQRAYASAEPLLARKPPRR